MNFAIGITTHNRPELFKRTLDRIYENTTGEFQVYVVDDASLIVPNETRCPIMRNTSQKGIAYSKNRLLRSMINYDHIFLFDDDCWPVQRGWHDAYIGAHEAYSQGVLCYTFTSMLSHNSSFFSKLEIPSTIKGLRMFRQSLGCMMSITRHCLDTVGGFYEGFGMYGGEHTDYVTRAFNMGVNTYPHLDIHGSDSLFYAMDREPGHTSANPLLKSSASHVPRFSRSNMTEVEMMVQARASCKEKVQL